MSGTTPGTGRTAFSYRVLAALLPSLAIASLAGCATGPKTYEIKGEVDSIVNRDAGGKSLSIAIRIYQLKDATEFSKLTFDTVASGRPESELLGPELLSQSEIIMIPAGRHVTREQLLEGAKYLGVVGLFRQPDPHYWRFLVEADKIRSEGLSFKIQDCGLVLLSTKRVAIPGQPENAPLTCAGASQSITANPGRSGSASTTAARNLSNAQTSATEIARTIAVKVRKP